MTATGKTIDYRAGAGGRRARQGVGSPITATTMLVHEEDQDQVMRGIRAEGDQVMKGWHSPDFVDTCLRDQVVSKVCFELGG